ncbi:hypothetical protein [Pontimicrobium sp. MEBiC01747]
MCWRYTGTEKKRGDIVVGDTIIAKDKNYKEQLEFIKQKRLEAAKKA